MEIRAEMEGGVRLGKAREERGGLLLEQSEITPRFPAPFTFIHFSFRPCFQKGLKYLRV